MNTQRMSTRSKEKRALRAMLLFAVLLFTAVACNLPRDGLDRGRQEQEPPSTDAISRAVQQTLTIVARDQGESGDEITPPPTTPPGEESTPAPSMTPPASPTPEITITPWVNVSGNTNCRSGPGDVYDLIHIYLAGDQAVLIGKDGGENFWYIQHPDESLVECWLWGRYATPVGETTALPVFTPPPTPTPSLNFSVSFEGSDCGAGSCWMWFKITNTGGLPLESVRTYVKNTVTKDDATQKANVFKTGVAGSDVSQAAVGAAVFTHSGQLPNPGGDKLKAELTVCSKDGLGGVCMTKNLTFNP